MNPIVQWLLDKAFTVLAAAFLVHLLTKRREKEKRLAEGVRAARQMRRRLVAEMNLALVAMARLQGELDPTNPTTGNCATQLSDLENAMKPLVEAEDGLDDLGDSKLVAEIADWIRRVRLLIDEARNKEIGVQVSEFGIVGELMIRPPEPPARADVRRKTVELLSKGNALFESVRALPDSKQEDL